LPVGVDVSLSRDPELNTTNYKVILKCYEHMNSEAAVDVSHKLKQIKVNNIFRINSGFFLVLLFYFTGFINHVF